MKFLFLALSCGLVSAQDSYNEMYNTIEPKVNPVDYVDGYDGGYPLTGYVSIPEETPAPAVVIVVSFEMIL